MSRRHGESIFALMCNEDEKKGYFTNPVNAIKDEAYDYHDVIQKPMDFSTIKSKLETYSSVDDLFSDIFLIFDNAMTYNPPGHPVHDEARRLRSVFVCKIAIEDDMIATVNLFLLSKY